MLFVALGATAERRESEKGDILGEKEGGRMGKQGNEIEREIEGENKGIERVRVGGGKKEKGHKEGGERESDRKRRKKRDKRRE